MLPSTVAWLDGRNWPIPAIATLSSGVVIKIGDGWFLGPAQKIRDVGDCQIDRAIRDVFAHRVGHIAMQKRSGGCQSDRLPRCAPLSFRTGLGTTVPKPPSPRWLRFCASE